jgi:hypothetical protein
MDELAKDTGGEAIYNTNGLNDAVNRVLNDGTHYYTLTYTPTNKKMDSRLRHIEVTLTQGDWWPRRLRRSSPARAIFGVQEATVSCSMPFCSCAAPACSGWSCG